MLLPVALLRLPLLPQLLQPPCNTETEALHVIHSISANRDPRTPGARPFSPTRRKQTRSKQIRSDPVPKDRSAGMPLPCLPLIAIPAAVAASIFVRVLVNDGMFCVILEGTIQLREAGEIRTPRRRRGRGRSCGSGG